MRKTIFRESYGSSWRLGRTGVLQGYLNKKQLAVRISDITVWEQ